MRLVRVVTVWCVVLRSTVTVLLCYCGTKDFLTPVGWADRGACRLLVELTLREGLPGTARHTHLHVLHHTPIYRYGDYLPPAPVTCHSPQSYHNKPIIISHNGPHTYHISQRVNQIVLECRH